MVYNLKKLCQILPKCTCASRRYSQQKKSINVALLGADTNLGFYTSFLLKQNPLISILNLQGSNVIESTMHDLLTMDTRCHPQVFVGKDKIGQCIETVDLIIILGISALPTSASVSEIIMDEGQRLKKIVKVITEQSPKAIIIDCVPPVSITLPIIAGLYKDTVWYHPGKLIGYTGLVQLKANTMAALFQSLDPYSVHVPIVGGPEKDTAVPLFSQSSPVGLLEDHAKALTAKFRGVREDRFPEISDDGLKVTKNDLTNATAINRLVTSVGLGLCNDGGATDTVFIRSNVVPLSKHCVSTVRFGPSGVVHNYGLPKLSRLELSLLEKALLTINEREYMAEEFIKYSGDDPSNFSFVSKEKETAEIAASGVIK